MNIDYRILGLFAATFVFGAYFVGLFQNQRRSISSEGFFRDITNVLTWRGVAWSVVLPVLWVLIYYAFIACVWVSLGRWPRFGEPIDGLASFLNELTRILFGALVGSLYVAPIVLIVCLFLRPWRHVSVYVLCYGAAIGLASCGFFLAPREFLNWFFD
jgi:hypothetical protein